MGAMRQEIGHRDGLGAREVEKEREERVRRRRKEREGSVTEGKAAFGSAGLGK